MSAHGPVRTYLRLPGTICGGLRAAYCASQGDTAPEAGARNEALRGGSEPGSTWAGTPLPQAGHPAPTGASQAVSPGGGNTLLAPPHPYQFHAYGASAEAVTEARAAAVAGGRTTLVCLTGTIERSGADVSKELARLFSIVGPGRGSAELSYDVSVETAPSARCRVALKFQGAPADYAPIQESVRQTMASHVTTLQAKFEAVFQPPVPLTGNLVEQLLQAAKDTGPHDSCAITMTTEGDGGA